MIPVFAPTLYMPTVAYVPLGSVHVAVADLSANKAAAAYSNTVVGWDAENDDTDSFHDNATANSRLTIPSSLTGRYGIVTGTAEFNSVSAGAHVAMGILKNGSNVYDGAGTVDFQGDTDTFQRLYCQTQPVLLATGDYFEMALWCNSATAVLDRNIAQFSALSILIVG